MGTRIGSGFGIFKGAGSGCGSALTVYNSDSFLAGYGTVNLSGNDLMFQKGSAQRYYCRVFKFHL
jgi:hypothetical protein